jgi:hypothetical protein
VGQHWAAMCRRRAQHSDIFFVGFTGTIENSLACMRVRARSVSLGPDHDGSISDLVNLHPDPPQGVAYIQSRAEKSGDNVMTRTRVVLITSLLAFFPAGTGNFATAEENCLSIENTCHNTCAAYGQQRGGQAEMARCKRGCSDRASECASRNARNKPPTIRVQPPTIVR